MKVVYKCAGCGNTTKVQYIEYKMNLRCIICGTQLVKDGVPTDDTISWRVES